MQYQNRPFCTVENMNCNLIDNWNSKVGHDDIVFHLGSFGLGTVKDQREKFIELNGKITLVRSKDDAYIKKLIEIGFDSIADKLEFEHGGYRFIMTHDPLSQEIFDDDSHGFINLHGSSIGSRKIVKNRVNVSSFLWEYSPVSLDEILIEYKKKGATRCCTV